MHGQVQVPAAQSGTGVEGHVGDVGHAAPPNAAQWNIKSPSVLWGKHEYLKCLIRYRLHIVGEVSVDVRHCLMALPGVRKEDLRRVQSHPQALSQCDAYLSAMSGVVREAVSDTAGAAQAIAQNNHM